MALTVNVIPRYKGLSGSSPQIQDSGITDNGTYITLARTLNLTEETEPSTPGPGTAYIYVDVADSHLKIKDDGGNVTDLNSAGGGGGAWGGITGTLSDQTDLQAALDAKGAAFTSSATLRSILGDETGTGAAVFATSPTLVTPILGTPTSGTLTNCTGLPIAGGGTGQATRQAAIDALTDVSSATNEHVLTKDTASGNAIFKAASGGVFTDSGTNVYLTTTTDRVVIGNTSAVGTSTLSVDGNTDQIQCTIQGHSTQTSNIFVVEKSDGTDLLAVSNTAGVTFGGTTSAIYDANSNELVLFTATASAVNEVTLANAATGNDPSLTASGGDSNIGIDLVCKGTGGVTLRHEPRVTTITSSATPTINTDNCDAVTITALAAAITSMTTNLSGTPKNFQRLMIRIKDDGTARAITWGTSFEACGFPLPTTTVASKRLTILLIYDSVAAKWGCISASQEA